MTYSSHRNHRQCLAHALMALVLLVPSVDVSAQADSAVNQLNVGINYLAHGEMMRGGLPADDNDEIEDKSNFLLGRFRLNVGYVRQGLEARAVIQNKNVWGTDGSQALKLYEGWVKMTAKNGLFGQIGRIALSYDDERIIGTNDFAMASLSHDVLRVGYEGHGHQLHAILAYNQNASHVYKDTYYQDGDQFYKNMQTIWYHYDLPRVPLGVSLLFMNVGVQSGEQGSTYNPPSTEYQRLYGTYLKYQPKFATLEASAYKQDGRVVSPIHMGSAKLDTWMASVKATVTPSDNYGFVLGYDYLSGDDYVPVSYGGLGMVQHKVFKGFSPLFGSRAKFYGIMDYFYESAYINGFTPGLQNAFVGASGKPIPKMSCSATYHYLAVATNLTDLDRTLGHSVELEASYRFSEVLKLTVAYTWMYGTETMDRLKQSNGSKSAQWGWFSLVLSPKLFTTKF